MPTRRLLGTGALAFLLLTACLGPPLDARLALGGRSPREAAGTRLEGSGRGGLLDIGYHQGERTTSYVETLDLTDDELELLRCERALRDPATWPQPGPATCAEAAMDAARDGQGSNDPLKQKRPAGICLPVGRLLQLLKKTLEK